MGRRAKFCKKPGLTEAQILKIGRKRIDRVTPDDVTVLLPYWDGRLDQAGLPMYRAEDTHKLTYLPQTKLEQRATELEDEQEDTAPPERDEETYEKWPRIAWKTHHPHCPDCNACLLFPTQLHRCPGTIQADILAVIHQETRRRRCGGGRTVDRHIEEDGTCQKAHSCFDRLNSIKSNTSIDNSLG